MNKFDKSVNILLENLIFEQDQNEIDPSQVIEKTALEMARRNREDKAAYIAESEAKFNSDEEYLDKVINYIKNLPIPIDQITEETGLETTLGAIKDFGSAAWDKAKEYVGPALYDIGEYTSDKIGEYVTDFLGKEYVDDINNNLSETIWYKIAAIFEPTGVMSWPYYDKALKAYETHKGTDKEDIYFLNLLAAQLSVIPGFRLPLGILTAPLKLLLRLPLLPVTIPMKIASFVRGAVSKSSSALKASAKLEKTAAKGIGAKGLKAVKTVTRPASTRIKSAAKAVGSTAKTAAKAVGSTAKTAAKVAATGAKVGTVVSSGDIPQTWKDWTEAGKKSLEDAKPMERTLGKFPSFNHLSTQRF